MNKKNMAFNLIIVANIIENKMQDKRVSYLMT